MWAPSCRVIETSLIQDRCTWLSLTGQALLSRPPPSSGLGPHSTCPPLRGAKASQGVLGAPAGIQDLSYHTDTGLMILFPSQPSPGSRSALPGKKTTLQAALLETLLDLVDRSWGGCRSLHSNEAFLSESGWPLLLLSRQRLCGFWGPRRVVT